MSLEKGSSERLDWRASNQLGEHDSQTADTSQLDMRDCFFIDRSRCIAALGCVNTNGSRGSVSTNREPDFEGGELTLK
jgi:hypothetical protein